MSRLTGSPIYAEIQKHTRFWIKEDPITHEPYVEAEPRYALSKVPAYLHSIFRNYTYGQLSNKANLTIHCLNSIAQNYEVERIQYKTMIRSYTMTDEVKKCIAECKDINSPSCIPVKAIAGGFHHYPMFGPGSQTHIVFVGFLYSWYAKVAWGENVRTVCQNEEGCCGQEACTTFHLLLKTPDNPIYRAHLAFSSGGSPQGLVEALKKSMRFRLQPLVDPETFALAYLRTMKDCLWDPEPITFTKENMKYLPINEKQSAGFLPVKAQRILLPSVIRSDGPQPKHYTTEKVYDDPTPIFLDFVNNCKQGEAKEFSIKEFWELYHKIKERVKSGQYSQTWFKTLVSKSSIKVEVRAHDADKLKTRVIFVACLIHLLIDKQIYKDFMSKSYQKGSNMIGHQWRKGGAYHFACKMGWKRIDCFWMTYDIKNFDQCALAAVIELLMMMPYFFYDLTDGEDDEVVRTFFLQRAHEMACKIVKWVGDEFRLIIGQIFSGVYPTSWLGTMYLVLVRYYIELATYKEMKLKDPEKAERFKNSWKSAGQYGDDSFPAYLKEFFSDLIGEPTLERPLGKYQEKMEQYFGLVIKTEPPPEIFGMGEPYSREPPDGGSPFITRITTLYTEHGAYENVVEYQGPIFLKRSFVLLTGPTGVKELLPWRHENDAFDKIAISTATLDLDFNLMASKYMGLMIDTCGTNAVAYQALRHIYYMTKAYTKGTVVEETYNKYKIKMGFHHLPDEILLDRSKLLNEFVWDEDWRRSWAYYKNTDLYDDYGNVRSKQGPVYPEADLNLSGSDYEEASRRGMDYKDVSTPDDMLKKMNDYYNSVKELSWADY